MAKGSATTTADGLYVVLVPLCRYAVAQGVIDESELPPDILAGVSVAMRADGGWEVKR